MPAKEFPIRPGILERFRLDGKVALVTGAATGLGAAIAEGLAEAGATVACHGNRRGAEQTVEGLQGKGYTAASFQADLSRTESAAELTGAVLERLGRIDVLVNNAGTIIRHDAAHYPLEDWLTVLQVNLTSVFQLAQLTAQHMMGARRGGKIINIASLLSFQGGIRVPAYAASKGGVAQLTKALANEWAKYHINVNAIAPGYFRTSNTEALQQDPSRNEQILGRIPAGRWGEPDDLIGAVVFLSSPASEYVSGAVLNVDGGWLAR